MFKTIAFQDPRSNRKCQTPLVSKLKTLSIILSRPITMNKGVFSHQNYYQRIKLMKAIFSEKLTVTNPKKGS